MRIENSRFRRLNGRRRGLAGVAAIASAAAAAVSPLARAEVSANSSGSAQQNGVGNPAVTISMSGSTAMRNFTTSPFITLLTPGQSITLNDGTAGAPVTYTAPTGVANLSFQLASPNFTSADVPVGGPFPSTNATQVHSAIRFEWHEQGSVEGILDMANDQIGYFGGATGAAIINLGTRNPSSGNPIWVNQKSYSAPTAGTNGLSLSSSTYNTYSNYDASGRNLQGGQNRVQMAISDVNGAQGFAIGGTSATGSIVLTPGLVGYGKGNNTHGLAFQGALGTSSAAVAGAFYQLNDQSVLNMETTKLDPATGANYASGAWNSGGVANLDNHAVAVTATLFVANPGTGLDKINRTDAQWMQTTGRFSNGAAFNMTTRDVGSGTRNVAALNTGVDPTFAVGVNDDGNGNELVTGHLAADQSNIGPALRFSNKTAGGGQLRPTVQNNRMAIGTLSMSDALTAVRNSSTPLRALDYSDSADGSSGYVSASASSITDGSYVIWQNETYVTVKAPNGAFAGDSANQWAARTDAETGIKGDNSGSNVAQFRSNILQSVAAFPNTSTLSNPADGLLNKSFILPQMMQKSKHFDGIGTTFANPDYNDTLRTQFLGSVYANNFAPLSPTSITTGGGSPVYGQGGNNTASFNGQIPITSKNYLFGNFNQLGTRDYAALQTAQAAQAALATSGAGVSIFTADGGLANSTAVPTGVPALDTMNSGGNATKGDLIVLGDLNGDGRFDGRDLYLFATGAALSDSTNVASLTPTGGETLGDALRRGILRKNDALDWLQANATAQQKIDASANLTNDPTGANAFNKFDINRDGRVSRNDAAIVDKFFGWDKTNINQQLSATINNDGSINPAGTQRPINLYQVGLIDGRNTIGRDDFAMIRAALGSHLAAGDVNFDGQIDKNDIRPLATSGFYNDGLTTHKWSEGDFNGDGTFDKNDVRLVATGGLYNTGNYDGGNPSIATPTLTGRSAEPATTSAPTFIYNPSTGDVTVTTNGNGGVVELDLISAGNKFITANSKLASAGYQFITNTTHEQDGFTPFGSFVADGFDMGNILPAGLTDQQIASDLTAFYSATGNVNGAPANVTTPEPAGLALLGLGAAGLLARRRRRR